MKLRNLIFVHLLLFPFCYMNGVSACAINFSKMPSSDNFFIKLDFDYESGQTFGRGYDSLSGNMMGDCVEKAVSETPNGSESKRITFSVDQITNLKSLLEKFNVSTSASLRKGLGKMSAKSQFISENNLSEFNIYVLAKVQVQNILTTLKDVRLKEEAVELYNKDPEAFRRTCGDEYVGVITSGGEFYAVIEIETKTEAHKNEILNKIRGNIGFASGEINFTKTLNKISMDNRTKVMVFQVGGKFKNNIIPTTPEEIIDHAKTFAATVVGNDSMPISLTTYSYQTIINFPHTRDALDIEFQEKVVAKMIEYQNQSFQNLANIDYIFNHPEQFEDPDLDQLEQSKQELMEEINLVNDAASTCFRNYSKCKMPEGLKSSKFKRPKRLGGKNWKELCAYKEDAACGVISYQSAATSACGVLSYNRSPGPQCGVEFYKLLSSTACGIEKFNEKTDFRCGIKKDIVFQNSDFDRCAGGGEDVFFSEMTDALRLVYAPMPEWQCGGRSKAFGGEIKMAATCTNLKTGQFYKLCRQTVSDKCRRPEFGVESYYSCRDKSHGIESYLPCRDSAFGIEEYMSCRHESHGVEKYRGCYLPKSGSDTCSQDSHDYL